MTTPVMASNRAELKKAMASGAKEIVITDEKLGKMVSIVTKASVPALVAAVAAVAGSASMSWNPIGWGVAAVGTAVSGPLIAAVAFLIVVIGVSMLYALKKDYDVENKVKVELPGFKFENATVLKRKKKTED